MSFEIRYGKQPRRFLRKLDKHLIKRIMDKIDELIVNPVPQNSKSIVGEHGIFRMRIGDHRALYRISQQDIIIVKLDKRQRVY